jgi:hypothetical protein
MSTFPAYVMPAVMWVLFLLTAALAVKQASYVLVYGSIFNWIRNGFKAGMRSRIFGSRLLHALFTCTLCMTTQIALWLVALPIALVVFFYGADFGLALYPTDSTGRILYAVVSGFCGGMAVAGLATVFMTRTEYPPNRFDELFRKYQELETENLTLRAASNGGNVPIIWGKAFTHADLVAIFDAIEDGCKGIDCIFALARCNISTFNEGVQEWVRRKGLPMSTAGVLRDKLAPLFSEYRNSQWFIHGNPKARKQLLDELYQKLFS